MGLTPESPYRVEVDTGGCEHCGYGKSWTVVYVPDDIADSTSFENEDEAIELCERLNDAFEKGAASASAAVSKGTTDGQ